MSEEQRTRGGYVERLIDELALCYVQAALDELLREDQIEDEAAEWVGRLSGTADERTLREFEKRVRESAKFADYFLRHATMDVALREALSGRSGS